MPLSAGRRDGRAVCGDEGVDGEELVAGTKQNGLKREGWGWGNGKQLDEGKDTGMVMIQRLSRQVHLEWKVLSGRS